MSKVKFLVVLGVVWFSYTVQLGGAEKAKEYIPADFPRFSFKGAEEQAKLLSHYLWYHFHNRLGNGLTVFNKEYLLTSDIWMGNALVRRTNQAIQEVDRNILLGIRLDDEGYVMSHQHFSHANDYGWPFPLWTQSDVSWAKVKGKTIGWHFQKDANHVRGWVGNYLKNWKRPEYVGAAAASLWKTINCKSLGVINNRWHLRVTGRSPAIVSPKGYPFDAFNAPYLQIRWTRSGKDPSQHPPYVEWLREKDILFGPDRRVYFYPDKTPLSPPGLYHSILAMYRHPKWAGKIKQIRICLAPGESEGSFEIDSIFTVYDTRHSINNPIFILSAWRYFCWTGDLDFLRRNINRMRTALIYQQRVMGGLKYNHIRNPWPGHDGLPGFSKDDKGKVTIHSGHGIGNNYWDLLPFGWDDFYATYQYYAATLAMADLEEAIEKHPGWQIPLGALRLDSSFLRQHAAAVKRRSNNLFWNPQTGRFYASIDKKGTKYDYGFTFVNLDAIWYGIASKKHAAEIMAWLDGKRIVKGDTSTGADIYHWRFGPRATTVRNVKWYGQGWYNPEGIPWGGQVQDGGAVLGFSFYDLWARLQVLGADNAWQRLMEIMQWEKEVQAAGGYRKYYAGGKRGTTLQGGGTAGGLGIDYEFFESSLIPSIVTYGFMGLQAVPEGVLQIKPALPKACPEISLSNLLYHGVRMDISVSRQAVRIKLKDRPVEAINISLVGKWNLSGTRQCGSRFSLSEAKTYNFFVKH